MSQRKVIGVRYLNRAGIPVFEINTVPLPAFYWTDGRWVATTTTVKLIKNR